MKVGFIGLGIMGKPMALNLGKGGHELFLQQPQRRAAGPARRGRHRLRLGQGGRASRPR